MEEVLSDLLIGLIGVIIGSFIPLVYARKMEWYQAREQMLVHISGLYSDIEQLAKDPRPENHYTFQFLFTRESYYIKNIGLRFFIKRCQLNHISDALLESYKSIILNPEHEEIILLSGTQGLNYPEFNCTIQAAINEAYSKVIEK